ncbi:hypothetical protein GpartN1_g5157.t1 [Galdieria partita]|uniref:4-hydroxy-3-methylbut-2-enyl diphosphate reductase n=1 Tax=Galdieria partita TaxID=83374 RepID=A0A9C7PUS5_9RHOD|nr:hypothetical protein GpartN1_g2097.t1 [Galdieria partita]GJQ13366.1 hypothetical protein GpartN1_g5157.t1 [Galdieria partita]
MMSFICLRYVTVTFQSWEKKKKVCFHCHSPKRVQAVGPVWTQCIEPNSLEEHSLYEESLDKRALRRKLTSSEKFNRRGFSEEKEATQMLMNSEFSSLLLQEARAGNKEIRSGKVTVKLASSYGFCWGVERAVAMALETRKHFPKQKIWITNEIIHNPKVNARLAEMNVQFVPHKNFVRDFSGVSSEDVVILPAFGATLNEMQYLSDLGCQIVDTTCPWVSKVWNSVDKHKRANCTSVIHGKWNHEETIATASFSEKYIIVLNIEQAQYICKYILYGGDKNEFISKFKNAMSSGFDPDRDLEAVGIANQTTMLKNETNAIAKLFEETMLKKFGPQELSKHFIAFNTICDATQERQDAMLDLVEEPLDLVLVVGGFNSSNTSHLQEIAERKGIPSYYIDGPERIGPHNRIVFRSSSSQELLEKENFLKRGPITIGVTSGASTPDKIVQDVLERVFMIHKLYCSS